MNLPHGSTMGIDYSSATGFWLSRDPLKEVNVNMLIKEKSIHHLKMEKIIQISNVLNDPLYIFISNDTQNNIDVLGLKKRSKGDCCCEAKNQGLDNGAGGGVICCDGRKVACNWIWKPDDNGGQNDTVEDIYEKCITKHELDHFDDIPDCSKGPGIDRPARKPGKKPADEEAHAGCIEIKCYEKNINKCNDAPDPASCKNEINNRINQLKNHPMYGRDC